MENKKLYETLVLRVLWFEEESFVRTSGELEMPTAFKVEGESVRWQDGWN